LSGSPGENEERRGVTAYAVLASLWPVSDAGTGAFMRKFYEERTSKDSASALADTQRAFILAHESPSIWAAFTLTGW
jgi:CHAT domain-containing protein